MANKPDQKHTFPLPKGSVHTLDPTGGTVVDDYGTRPIKDRYNVDPGQKWPRDPQRGLKKD